METTKPHLSGAVQLQRTSDGKISQARALRKRMTPAEELLWEQLRGKKCNGLKFRRQQIIDGFITDLFCSSKNLVVEVDGSIHDREEQKKTDEYRRRVFKTRGLRELRFRNEEISADLPKVLAQITTFK